MSTVVGDDNIHFVMQCHIFGKLKYLEIVSAANNERPSDEQRLYYNLRCQPQAKSSQEKCKKL